MSSKRAGRGVKGVAAGEAGGPCCCCLSCGEESRTRGLQKAVSEAAAAAAVGEAKGLWMVHTASTGLLGLASIEVGAVSALVVVDVVVVGLLCDGEGRLVKCLAEAATRVAVKVSRRLCLMAAPVDAVQEGVTSD